MDVNGTTEFSSNCTPQSGKICSDVFECADSYPGHFLIVCAIILNAVSMLPLSGWILWLARQTARITSSDFVILNLSVAEIFGNTSLLTHLLGAVLCVKVVVLVSNFVSSMLIVGQPLFQTYFCVERYLAVVHPLLYLKYMKAPKFKISVVGLVWLSVLLFAWFILDSYPKIPTFQAGLFLTMLVVCSFCSVMILWVLMRPKPGDGEKEGAYQQKRKAFVAVTVILVTLLFGYGTIACVIILRDHIPYNTYCLALGLSWCSLVPSALVQPYLYLSKFKNH